MGLPLAPCAAFPWYSPSRAELTVFTWCSALRDRRFNPIQAKELPYLRCTVSLLSCFEQAATWSDWEIGVHGAWVQLCGMHVN